MPKKRKSKKDRTPHPDVGRYPEGEPDLAVEHEEHEQALTRAVATNPDLYLDELTSQDQSVVIALVPPDLSRCQCEWPDTEVHTFGPKPIVRCAEEPTVVAFQRRMVDDDTPTGAMSLCADHRILIEHMYPGQCYFRALSAEKKIGGVV